MIFVAAHLSRAETLTEWLDPSVMDELDPDRRDLALDIYSAECPAQPPYTAEFIATFRARADRAQPEDHGLVPGDAGAAARIEDG